MCNLFYRFSKISIECVEIKLHMSCGQKMSKREQQRKIAAVREQINTLKLRVTKLESCLCTLREDPDQYIKNLNTKNREYVDWKNRNVKSKKDKENISSNEEEEEERGATTASTGVADNFGFFSTMVGFFHSSATSVQMWGASRSSSSSYGHTAPRVLLIILMYFWGQCILSLIGWDIFRDLMFHLTSLHLRIILFIKVMSKIVHLVILAGIPALLTHLPHLILLAVPLVPLLPITPGITLDVLVQIVSKNMLINTLIPLFPIHSLTFNYNA